MLLKIVAENPRAAATEHSLPEHLTFSRILKDV
jgi:hypothetical protein